MIAPGATARLDASLVDVATARREEGAIGTVATIQLSNGQTWGFVPARSAAGVDVALHDMSTRPHRLVATRSLGHGQTVQFDDVRPALTLRLATGPQ